MNGSVMNLMAYRSEQVEEQEGAHDRHDGHIPRRPLDVQAKRDHRIHSVLLRNDERNKCDGRTGEESDKNRRRPCV